MGSRYIKFNKSEDIYAADIDIGIERLKKVRALNCSLSDIGMDSYYVVKRLSFNKLNILTKFL